MSILNEGAFSGFWSKKIQTLHPPRGLYGRTIKDRGPDVMCLADCVGAGAVLPLRIRPDEWNTRYLFVLLRPFEQKLVIAQVITVIGCENFNSVFRSFR
ncbi:MAG: hypothetical protein AAGB18_08095, partial [Pseudomonadota bacterium]